MLFTAKINSDNSNGKKPFGLTRIVGAAIAAIALFPSSSSAWSITPWSRDAVPPPRLSVSFGSSRHGIGTTGAETGSAPRSATLTTSTSIFAANVDEEPDDEDFIDLEDPATWHGDGADGGEKREYIEKFKARLQISCLAPNADGLLPYCSLEEFKRLARIYAKSDVKFEACASNNDVALRVYATIKQCDVDTLEDALNSNFPPTDTEAFWDTLDANNRFIGEYPNDGFKLIKDKFRENEVNSGMDIIEVVETDLESGVRFEKLLKLEEAEKAYQCIIKAYLKHATASTSARAYVHNRLEEHYVAQSEDEKVENLKCIEYRDEDRQGKHQAYYVGEVDFRHQGKARRAPPLVFLKQPEEPSSLKPFVYYTPSGSGKSVEVASGAFTRDAVMTAVHYGDSEQGKEIEMKDLYQKRRTSTNFFDDRLKIIKEYVEEVMMENFCKNHLDVFKIVMDVVQESEQQTDTDAGTVRLVVAIDEASTIPYLVRSLIAENDKMRATAQTFLRTRFNVPKLSDDPQHDKFQVVFSIAGTGTSASTLGSSIDSHHVLEPTAFTEPKQVYDALSTAKNVPTYEEIENYPMLKVLAANNARMTSIMVDQMATMNVDYSWNIRQTDILQNVFKKFVNSNALSGLNNDRHKAAAAGAQTLAIHLFQKDWEVPADEPGIIDQSMDFAYGITFEAKEKCIDIRDTEYLIKTLGLVSPNITKDVIPGDIIPQPFKVDPAMQFLSMWLLMGGISRSSRTNFLNPTPFGFKVLSTQLVLCVLASSLVLPEDYRPDARTLLKDQLGFYFQESWADPFFDSKKTLLDDEREKITKTAYYNELEWQNARNTKDLYDNTYSNVIVTGTSFKNAGNSLHGTYFQRVETEITNRIAFNRYCDTSIISSETGEALQGVPDTQKIFNVDRAFIEPILQGLNEVDTSRRFNPPIASISFGDSEFVDGMVLFAGTSKQTNDGNNQQLAATVTATNADENGSSQLYCIGIQAKDDFDTSELDLNQIKKNARTFREQLLDDFFGDKRLYGVASHQDKLETKKEPLEYARPFVAFPVGKSKILQGLMQDFADEVQVKAKFAKRGIGVTGKIQENSVP